MEEGECGVHLKIRLKLLPRLGQHWLRGKEGLPYASSFSQTAQWGVKQTVDTHYVGDYKLPYRGRIDLYFPGGGERRRDHFKDQMVGVHIM